MSDTAAHESGIWYWEAETDRCPHGPEPEDDNTDAWDTWQERHQWSPQDVRICLDAPVGNVCLDCSAEAGEMVSWTDCHVREHTRPKNGITPNPGTEHQMVPVLVGLIECFDRECDDYFTEDGHTAPGVERCSHIREERVCSCQRGPDGEYGDKPCSALAVPTTGGATS